MRFKIRTINKVNHSFIFNLVIVLSSYLCCLSCSEISNEKKEHEVVKIDVNKEITKLKLSDIAENVSFTTLETNENCLITDIGKVLTTKDFIFVLDGRINASRLLMFGRDGKFVRPIGQLGGGPGEYTMPLDFILTPDEEIKILDNGTSIITYNFSGDFLKKEKLNSFTAVKLAANPKQQYAFISGGIDDHLIFADAAFQRKSSYFPFKNRAQTMIIPNTFYHIGERAIYRRPYDDMLYEIDFANKPIPYKSIDYTNNQLVINENITENDLNNSDFVYDYCVTTSVLENEKCNFVIFSYQGTPWVYIGNQQEEQSSKLFRYSNLINDVTYENRSYPIGVDNDRFIYYVNPIHVIHGVANMREQQKEPSEQIKALIENLSEESNPVLMFLSFKI